jgi:hypothetical protein
MNENNLSYDKIINNNKTYFFHVKKSDVSNINDLNSIQNLIKLNNMNTDINIDINNLKIINKSDLMNISYKKIGKYLRSNKNYICDCCKKTINASTIFKQLKCKHNFHTSCIDTKLKNDIYKRCTSCNTENISINI